MKQQHKKKIYLIVFLFLLCITGSTFFFQHRGEGFIKTTKKGVTEEKTIRKTCNADFSAEHFNTNAIEVSFVGRTITVSNVSQQLQVAFKTAPVGGDKEEEIYRATPNSDGVVTYTVPTTDGNGRKLNAETGTITVVFYPRVKYEDDTNLCLDTDRVFHIIPDKAQEQILNSAYSGEACTAYRNQYGNIEEMKEAVDYCFNQYVDVDYDESTVKGWIDTAVSTYEYKQAALSHKNTLTPDDENTVKDPSKLTKLMCDPYTSDIVNEDGTVSQYANSKTFNYTKTVYKGTYCRTVCKETVTVNYQAPVATQAGLCFSYRVEIKSKVDCTTESTGKKPKKQPVCTLTPRCYGTYDNGHDQAGPTEEFDQCIADCDHGEYSQKCINSCYKKVYGEDIQATTSLSNMSSTLHFETSPKAVQVASKKAASVDVDGKIVTCNSSFTGERPKYQDANGNNYTVEQIYIFRQHYPGGRYTKTANGRQWTPSGSCPSQAAYYYFSTKALTGTTLDGFRGPLYMADANGFKRQSANGYTCNSICYLKGSCPDHSLLIASAADDDYRRQLDNESADWKKCNESVNCNETTTEYTITVDKDDTNSPNYKKYKATLTPKKGNEPSGDSIIEDYSGHCYSKEDGWEYRNVLSFPQTWLSVKSGLTTSKKPSNENHYKYIGNTFCTSLSTEDVNVDWYDWKVNDNGDISKLTTTKKNAIEKNRVNNIDVRIGSNDKKLWGLMGWNFDVSCFYAVANPNTCTEECCGEDCPDPTTPDPETEKTMPTYTFRSISLNDVFPPSDDSNQGRAPRYNWSCQATNTTNKDYPVQPNATIANIEAKGDSIYSNANELDYEIDLTRGLISRVKEYNNTRHNYLDFDESGITKKVNGVTVYTSKFLTQVLGTAVRKRGKIGCNNQLGDSCDNTIVRDECYNALQ